MLKNDTLKTVLKFAGVAAAAIAGSLPSDQALLAGVLGAFSVACMSLTISGLDRADLQKAALKFAALACASVAGALQTTQPVYAALAGSLGTAFAAITVPAPGTAAKMEAARSSLPPPPRVPKVAS